jgi:cation diffusion facilitator family transporter
MSPRVPNKGNETMHTHSFGGFRHEHVFLGAAHDRNERRSWMVIAICGAMMVAEIGGGILFGSMALIADGLHMSTHAGALFIGALAYTYARRLAHDARFTFGTGKLGDLAAFTSAIALAMIALLIGYESVNRLIHPVHIAFNQAIPIAVLGLGVNLGTAWLLKDDHGHEHAHDADHDGHARHDHHHHHARDHNLRAAYVHVMADAFVSMLAIVGLVAGRQLGWVWMDAVMGIIGALVIASWSWGLVKAAGAVLLDMRPRGALAESIAQRLGSATDHVADLHVWRIGPGHCAAVVALVSDNPKSPSAYKALLSDVAGLSHVTVEVERCPEAD